MPSTAARLWSYLTSSLNAARPRSSDRTAGGEPSQYAMWLERDEDRWDWLDANLYRQRGPR